MKGKRRMAVAAAALGVFAPGLGAQGISEDITPRTAELMPLANQSLLLDVEDTGKRLIAVGERGHVLGSLDGQKWVQVPSPTRATLTAVAFADANNGWAVGHDAVIIRTRDGGRSWVLQNFEPGKEQPFLDLLFLDAKRGFAVGAYSMMYATSDGGETWEDFETPIREDQWHFNAITRLNNGNLFITGEAGTLAFSNDEGETWRSLESPYESSMFDGAPVGEAGVMIAGLRGNVFVTDDPGAEEPEWRQLEMPGENSVIGASALPSGEVVMVGINGIIYTTRDNATAVDVIDNPVGITLGAVLPVDKALVVVGEAGTQMISTKQ